MRPLPRLLLTTALTAALALPAPVSAQEIRTVRLERAEGSPLLGGLLLALLMVGLAGIGSDSRSDPPAADPDPDHVPPGGYRGDLRPRYVVGVDPFLGDPALGTGGDRSRFETPEYLVSWGLGRINAAARYAEGAFGDGALVSVFDTGVKADHAELSGRVDLTRSHSYFTGEMTDTDGHGSHVAAIIAGSRDGGGMHGVAPGATLLAFRAISGPETERVGSYIENWEDATLRSVEAGADVINHSWTFVTSEGDPVRITSLADRGAALDYFGSNLMGTFAYAAQQDLVSVYAAGNGNGGESSVTAGLPALIEELRGHWVSVVALDEADTIADYSSQCGIAADWCLAAPGTEIVSAGVGSEYELRSGTSMAAGFVSGSLALLKSNFPEITGATALQILKDTARDLGEEGVDPVYGHGAIDLETAMRPVGALNVQMSSVLNERTAPLAGSGITAPSAVAGPMRRALSASLMSATDAYDRAYAVPMGAMVASLGAPDAGPDLTRFALRGVAPAAPAEAGTFLTAGVPVGGRDAAMPDVNGFWGGHAGLLGDRAIGLTHVSEIGTGLRFGVTGAAGTGGDAAGVSYGAVSLSADLGASTLTFETGRLSEAYGMLGARFHGAFDGVSAQTSFLRASADVALSDRHMLHLTASSGQTDASGSGLIRSGRVRSESFGIGVSRRNARSGSVLSLGVSRPLGISGGSMDMAVPVGVAAASGGVASNEVRVESVSVGLDGGSAPLDLQFGYELPLGSARLGLGVAHRVGSEPGAGTSASLGVSFRF